VDGTGSGSCPVAGFGISGVEPSGSATRETKLLGIIKADCGVIEKLLTGFLYSSDTADSMAGIVDRYTRYLQLQESLQFGYEGSKVQYSR
jgi:hypothetical protein